MKFVFKQNISITVAWILHCPASAWLLETDKKKKNINESSEVLLTSEVPKFFMHSLVGGFPVQLSLQIALESAV